MNTDDKYDLFEDIAANIKFGKLTKAEEHRHLARLLGPTPLCFEDPLGQDTWEQRARRWRGHLDEVARSLSLLSEAMGNPVDAMTCGNPMEELIKRAAERIKGQAPAEGDAAPLRLTDGQWVNIVNHANCYRDMDKDEAVALAVKLTEARMAMNSKAQPKGTTKPIGHLFCGDIYGNELQDWEFVADQSVCDQLNELYFAKGRQEKVPVYIHTTQAPAPAPLTVPGGPEWLLPGDVAARIAYEFPGTVTAGVVQSIAKAVHQLRAASQAPAVGERAPRVESEGYQQRLAQDRLDAARYRFLRCAKLWPVPGNEYTAGLCVDLWDESGSGEQRTGSALDDAVDAAMAAEGMEVDVPVQGKELTHD